MEHYVGAALGMFFGMINGAALTFIVLTTGEYPDLWFCILPTNIVFGFFSGWLADRYLLPEKE